MTVTLAFGQKVRSENMKTYSEYRPTQFDTAGLALDDKQDWLVAPCGRNRDSNLLDESNWDCLVRLLEACDPEGNDHEIHRFGHWACGWFEIVIIRPGSACEKEAADCEAALADYPILDDMAYSERTCDAVFEYWGGLSLKDRIEECARAGVSIFAARRNECPGEVFDRLHESPEFY
jgi:hypothetical protein